MASQFWLSADMPQYALHPNKPTTKTLYSLLATLQFIIPEGSGTHPLLLSPNYHIPRVHVKTLHLTSGKMFTMLVRNAVKGSIARCSSLCLRTVMETK
jgi:hypothetical protein